jgi:hypothetical protein
VLVCCMVLYGVLAITPSKAAMEELQFSLSLEKLVQTAGTGDSSALEELHRLDKELVTNSSLPRRLVFLQKLRDLDPSKIGSFETTLIERYEHLMKNPAQLDERALEEVGAIAIIAHHLMSTKLAWLLYRDVGKVQPYMFKSNIVRGGWRPTDVDDWKGLQGRMMAAAIASGDPELTKSFIAWAEHTSGDLRMLIWWALAYSVDKQSVDYLLEVNSRSLTDRERTLVQFALSMIAVRTTSTLPRKLEKQKNGSFGVLTPLEFESLVGRIEITGVQLEATLKSNGIPIQSPMMMYAD